MGKSLNGKELGKGISQRKDGRYSARFVTCMGKRVEKYFPMVQEARRWLAEARMMDDCGTECGGCVGMTVDEWFRYWTRNIKAATVRPNTIRNYMERYRFYIKMYLGKKLMHEVRPMHCQLVLNKMEEDYAGSTIRQALLTMWAMFESAAENKIIPENPVNKSVKVPKPIETKIRVLTLEEQELFMKAAEHTSSFPQYQFILQTGVRTGELVGLKWEDIDFDEGFIKIRRTMEYRPAIGEWRVGPTKTKSGIRDIPMTKVCRQLLLELRERLKLGRYVNPDYEDFVFLNSKGEPTKNSTYDAHIQKVTKKIGMQNFSMHTLRHTFATRCIEAGMRPKTLQKLLGHARLETTMNQYVHVTDDEKHKEMEKFEKYDMEMA